MDQNEQLNPDSASFSANSKKDKKDEDDKNERRGSKDDKDQGKQTPQEKEKPQSQPSTTTNPAETSQFQVLWNEYVHRIKVHELLRCLEVEQKKLQVLRDNLDLKELKEENADIARRKNREAKLAFQKTLEEEETAAETIANEIRKNKEEPDYVMKSVKRLFMDNRPINDEQFERILDLCKDAQERNHLQLLFQDKKNREKYLFNATEDRQMLYAFLNSGPMQMFMLIIIFLSTIILFLLCFETITVSYSFFLVFLDSVIMAVFIVEAGLKLYIYKDDYFRSLANFLDLLIILTHFFEIFVDLVTQILAMSIDISNHLAFKLLKSLRALRVLRAIKFLPNLQIILTTIIQSLISISSIAALMILFMFVFAVTGRELFREEDEKRFGNVFRACLTLFQLLTLDDWGDILEENGTRPIVFVYLFLYIIVEYFVFLNLFVAVLVDNFQLSIEAANVAGDKTTDNEKWKRRLEQLGQESSSTSLHSRHKDPIHELNIEEYMHVDKNSREGQLLTENLKKLAAIDYQYFMWNRRMSLSSLVLEAATEEKGHPINLGQIEEEIPPIDVIEPRQPNPDDSPLKPKRLPRKSTLMGDSSFQLTVKKKKRKSKKRRKISDKENDETDDENNTHQNKQHRNNRREVSRTVDDTNIAIGKKNPIQLQRGQPENN